MVAPDGTSLKDMPLVRSLFQKAMGDQNLAKLNKLAKDPKVMQSLIDMENADQIADPMSFHHNRRIVSYSLMLVRQHGQRLMICLKW